MKCGGKLKRSINKFRIQGGKSEKETSDCETLQRQQFL